MIWISRARIGRIDRIGVARGIDNIFYLPIDGDNIKSNKELYFLS